MSCVHCTCEHCGAERQLYHPCPECGYPTFTDKEPESLAEKAARAMNRSDTDPTWRTDYSK